MGYLHINNKSCGWLLDFVLKWRHHNRSYSLKGKVLPTLVEGCFLVIDHARGRGFIYVWTVNCDNQLTMYK